MEANIKNRAVITNPTNMQLENMLICDILSNAKSGCVIDYKRFIVLQKLAASSYTKIKWGGKSLMAYIDNIIKRAHSYTRKITYLQGSFSNNGANLGILTFKNEDIFPVINSTVNLTISVFSSSELKIDLKRFVNPINGEKVCFYFSFKTTETKTTYLNFNVCEKNMSSFTHGFLFFRFKFLNFKL